MAPERCLAALKRAALAILFVLPTAAPAAHALKIVNYNITNYPSANGAGRDPYFRIVMAPTVTDTVRADIVVSQELQSQAGVDEFRNSVLNTLEPGMWASAPFTNGNDTDNALFYKPSKVQFLGQWSFYPNPANLLRLVNCYRLKPVGYSDGSAELRIYSQHLKASQGFESQRLAEATGIRDSMNAVPPGTHCILLGDFNIYTSTEPAFQKLLENQADNDGRVYDPLNAVGAWHDGSSFAPIHSQCPCLSCPTGSGFSGGGLDDRFDMFLPTLNMGSGEGLSVVPGSYHPVGNDGLHFNLNITDPPTIPEGATYANALWNASDHLPIRIVFQVPAKIGVASSLDFGTVIVGATADLSVSNPAVPPADELSCTFAASAGFSPLAGSADVPAGGAATIGIATTPGAPGPRAGTLTVGCDDPDQPSPAVSLAANVLDHASASLDPQAAVLQETLDFGSHEPGGFSTESASVYNRGYSSLQARLQIGSETITGWDGRFSIAQVSGSPLVADSARAYVIAFDDAGATQDSTYEANLTVASADEALPGAAAQPDLMVTLTARVQSGPAAAPGPAAPAVTRLHAPAPNPLASASVVRFDLARPGRTRVEVFDLTGRRVALLADRDYPVGRYALSWSGRDDAGAEVGPAVYFVRLSGPGLHPQSARLAVVR